MEAIQAVGPNADQITYWNSDAAQKWARNHDEMDRVMAPVAARIMAFAVPARGEKVLDVGCGCGATTLAAAERVGAEGEVLGIDISGPMLGHARKLAGASRARFLLADAATHAFPPQHYDLVLSRFGVMFFADPVAAFANIRKAMKPGGRLAFGCWQPMKANQWVMIPMSAALAHLPPPEPVDPMAPGPFALADRARTEAILRDAGFSSLAIEPADVPVQLGRGGPQALDEAVRFTAEIGPTSRLLEGATESQRAAAVGAIRAALAPHVKADGITLNFAMWLVGARA